jgi:hypothetical protein
MLLILDLGRIADEMTLCSGFKDSVRRSHAEDVVLMMIVKGTKIALFVGRRGLLFTLCLMSVYICRYLVFRGRKFLDNGKGKKSLRKWGDELLLKHNNLNGKGSM